MRGLRHRWACLRSRIGHAVRRGASRLAAWSVEWVASADEHIAGCRVCFDSQAPTCKALFGEEVTPRNTSTCIDTKARRSANTGRAPSSRAISHGSSSSTPKDPRSSTPSEIQRAEPSWHRGAPAAGMRPRSNAREGSDSRGYVPSVVVVPHQDTEVYDTEEHHRRFVEQIAQPKASPGADLDPELVIGVGLVLLSVLSFVIYLGFVFGGRW